MFTGSHISEIKKIDGKTFKKLILLGLLFYTITQGAQFVGLSLLPAVTVSLMLNFTPVIVAVLGIVFLSEYPRLYQWFGVVLFFTGIMVYFYPAELGSAQITGLIVMFIGILANAFSAVLGRDLNRSAKHHPLVITVISMGFGSFTLLIIGIAVQGFPHISTLNFIYLLWLAVINTAFAFTLWNLTLRSLTAMESSIINGTMLFQIAFLGWIFLGEEITTKEAVGIIIAAAGALLVQIKFRKGKFSQS